MRNRPWLQKEDPVWRQTVQWTTAREYIFQRSAGYRTASEVAKNCPDIEEARWFATITIPAFEINQPIIARSFIGDNPDLRSLTYSAIIGVDYDLLAKCALAGNPMAQFYACRNLIIMEQYPEFKYELCQTWIEKSMNGGYSEAFFDAEYKDLNRRRDCYYRGIQLGSVQCMNYYGLTSSNDLDKIYWTGQAWLMKSAQYHKFARFEDFCLEWYDKFVAGNNYASEAFVIATIVKTSTTIPANDRLYRIFEAAKTIHRKMSVATDIAVVSWLIISTRLNICRDMRNIVAKLIWQTRDQPEWEE